jgi:hypothetical protein
MSDAASAEGRRRLARKLARLASLVALIALLFWSPLAFMRYQVAVRTDRGWIDDRRLTRPPFERPTVADNAYDTYQEAVALLPPTADDERERLRDVRRGEAPPESVEALLAAFEPALAKVREAEGRPYVSRTEPRYEVTMPYLAKYRRLAGALAARVIVEHAAGRDAEALAAARDGYTLATDCPRYGTVVEGLVGAVCGQMTAEATGRVLPEAELPPAELLAHARWARQAGGGLYPLSGALNLESRFGDDLFARIAARDETLYTLADGNEPGPGRLTYWARVFDAQGAEGVSAWWDDRWARLMAAADLPYADDALDRLSERTIEDLKARNDRLGPMMFPDAGRCRAKWAQLAGLLAAEEALAGLRAFELDHGRPAATLAELVPTYLPGVPEDPFAGAPLCYRVEDGGFVLYSVGPNEVDNGASTEKMGVPRLARGDDEPAWAADLVYADTRRPAESQPAPGDGASKDGGASGERRAP